MDITWWLVLIALVLAVVSLFVERRTFRLLATAVIVLAVGLLIPALA